MPRFRCTLLALYSLSMVSCSDARAPSNPPEGVSKTATESSVEIRFSKNPEMKINDAFSKWKQEKISSGEYKSYEKCMASMQEGIAIPPNNEIKYQYKDINGDEIIDGIFSYNPVQCDGGNALGNYIEEVYVSSNSSGGYYVTVGDPSAEADEEPMPTYPQVSAPKRQVCVQAFGSPNIHVDRVYDRNGTWFVDYQQWDGRQWSSFRGTRVGFNTTEITAGAAISGMPQSSIYFRWSYC